MDFTQLPQELINEEVLSYSSLSELYPLRYFNRRTLERYQEILENSSREEVLQTAIQWDDPELIDLLLERYPDQYRTFYYIALRNGALAVVLYLLDEMDPKEYNYDRDIESLLQYTRYRYPELADEVYNKIVEISGESFIDYARWKIASRATYNQLKQGEYQAVEQWPDWLRNLLWLAAMMGELTVDVLERFEFRIFPKYIQEEVYLTLLEYNQLTSEHIKTIFR